MLFELDVELETDPGQEHKLRRVAEIVKDRCLVWSSLDVPVRLDVEVRARARSHRLRRRQANPHRSCGGKTDLANHPDAVRAFISTV